MFEKRKVLKGFKLSNYGQFKIGEVAEVPKKLIPQLVRQGLIAGEQAIEEQAQSIEDNTKQILTRDKKKRS